MVMISEKSVDHIEVLLLGAFKDLYNQDFYIHSPVRYTISNEEVIKIYKTTNISKILKTPQSEEILLKELNSKSKNHKLSIITINSHKYLSIEIPRSNSLHSDLVNALKIYNSLQKIIIKYKEEEKYKSLLSSNNQTLDEVTNSLINILESIGFNSTKRHKSKTLLEEKSSLLVALTLNTPSSETFHIVIKVLITTWSINLKLYIFKNMKPFSFTSDEIKKNIQSLCLKLNQMFKKFKITIDEDLKCPILEHSFFIHDMFIKEIQRNFLIAFFENIDTFNVISPYLISAVQNEDLDLQGVVSVLNKKKDKNIFFLNIKESAFRVIYPDRFIKMVFKNKEKFRKEVEILNVLEERMIIYWYLVDESEMTVYYPRFDGYQVHRSFPNRKKDKKIIEFKCKLINEVKNIKNIKNLFEFVQFAEEAGVSLFYFDTLQIYKVINHEKNYLEDLKILENEISANFREFFSACIRKVEISESDLDEFDYERKIAKFIGKYYEIIEEKEINYNERFFIDRVIAWMRYNDRILLLIQS